MPSCDCRLQMCDGRLGAAQLDTVEVALMPEQVAWNCTSEQSADVAHATPRRREQRSVAALLSV